MICSAFLAEIQGAENFRKRNLTPPNFRAANIFPKMLADLVLHSERPICPSEIIGINQLPFYEGLR